jgi:hypothetical protein
MSYVTPPTDNLYKFISIGGIALVAWSLYWPRQMQYEINKGTEVKREQLNTHIHLDNDINADVLSRWIGIIPTETFAVHDHIASKSPNPFSEDPLARAAWRESTRQHIDILTLVANPGFSKFKDRVIERAEPDIRDILGLPPTISEHDDFQHAWKRYKDTINSARQEEVSKFYLRETIWSDEEQVKSWQSHANLTLYGGAFMIIAGFVLWWAMLQRHEDVILLSERKEKCKHVKPLLFVRMWRNMLRQLQKNCRQSQNRNR